MNLRPAFFEQAKNNDMLGSLFTVRVLRLLPDVIDPDSDLAARLAGFTGDLGPYGHSLPLRLLGGLHGLVLRAEAPELTEVYPPNAPTDEALHAGLSAALTLRETALFAALEFPPQTNEVRRAAALIAGASVLAARYGLPFQLSELGASVGLNLMFDRYSLTGSGWRRGARTPALTLAPDWEGEAPPEAMITVAARRGVDLNPLNARDSDTQLRLLSYLWPDQPERLSLTHAAFAAFDADLDRGDAADWLETRLREATPGQIHLVYHTIAWQYFPLHVQARCLAALDAAGAKATDEAPLARLSMEADGGEGAALTLTTWPGGETEPLARVDFHGRWLRWRG